MKYLIAVLLLTGCASPKTHNDYYREMATLTAPDLCYRAALGMPSERDYINYELARRYTRCTQQLVDMGARRDSQERAASDAMVQSVSKTLSDIGQARKGSPTLTCVTVKNITTCN